MTATDVPFRPFRIGAMKLANRIVRAPMTRTAFFHGDPALAGWKRYTSVCLLQ